MIFVRKTDVNTKQALINLIKEELTDLSRNTKHRNFKNPTFVLSEMVLIADILNRKTRQSGTRELPQDEKFIYILIEGYLQSFLNSGTRVSRQADNLSFEELNDIYKKLNKIQTSEIKEKLPQYEELN